jgi:hypothetical protein
VRPIGTPPPTNVAGISIVFAGGAPRLPPVGL